MDYTINNLAMSVWSSQEYYSLDKITELLKNYQKQGKYNLITSNKYYNDNFVLSGLQYFTMVIVETLEDYQTNSELSFNDLLDQYIETEQDYKIEAQS